MARVALALALVLLTGTANAAVITLKQTFASPDCTGAPTTATTTPGAACAAGLTKVPTCTPGAAGSTSEACFDKTAFASPWTSLVPVALLGDAGADLTFEPDNCAKVGSVKVSTSGGGCAVGAGGDAAATFCQGPKLFTVTFANATECAAAPGVKITSTPVECAGGKAAGYCVNAAVPAGCKSDFLAINPTVGATSCFGGGPGGKTGAVKSVALPEEVPAAAAAAAAEPAAAAAPAAAAEAPKAPEPAKASAAAAAISAGAMAAAAVAMLVM